MSSQRGYKTKKETDKHIIALKPDKEKVCVFLTIEPKLNVESFKFYVGKLNEMKISHGIIVYQCITPATKKLINNTNELGIDLEIFPEDRIRFIITNHRLVPKHVKLSQQKAKQFKEKYGTNFPVLLTTDPVARFYTFKKGDIIEIRRRNGVIAYRIVKSKIT